MNSYMDLLNQTRFLADQKEAKVTKQKDLKNWIIYQIKILNQILLLMSSFSRDANKKLHDTNDDLRSALDTSRSSQKRSYGGVRDSMIESRLRASYHGDYNK